MQIPLGDGIVLNRKRRLRTVLQNEAAECGLACLAMIADFYGHEVSLSALRRRFSVSAKGMGLQSLLNIADTMSLSVRPIRLELEDIGQLQLPAILHWNINHFVVLDKISRKGFCIHDPASGRRVVGQEELNRSFTGVAIELYPLANFERQRSHEQLSLSDLFQGSNGLAGSIIQLFILALIMQIFALASPILNQILVDDAITKGDVNLLHVLALGMILLLFITSSVRVLQSLVGLYAGTQISFQMRSALLKHVLKLPVSWFERRHVGDVISRFDSLGPVQNVLVNSGGAISLNIIVAIAALIMMLLYSPLLSMYQFSILLISMVSQIITFPYIRKMTDEGLRLDSKVQTIFLETIRGIRAFKLYGFEQNRVIHWQNEQAKLVNNQVAMAKFGLFGGFGSGIIIGLQQILVWYIGAKLVISGDLTLGMLFAFQAYSAQFSGAAGVLISQVFVIKTMRIHLDRLSDIVGSNEEVGLNSVTSNSYELEGKLELSDVSFRYADQENWVLSNVNVVINQGDFVCISGPSGGGKTTLIKLILGFERQQEGTLLIDGLPIEQFGSRSFRNQIGVVMQDDQLLAGTVSDNISFFDVDVSDTQVRKAAADAGILSEILALPMQFHTLVGDLGSSLSAGQKQRVLLARALYKSPKIIILDEGTANLDPKSESYVMDTLIGLPITRIVIAHHEGATKGATRFLNVVAGRVSEI